MYTILYKKYARPGESIIDFVRRCHTIWSTLAVGRLYVR